MTKTRLRKLMAEWANWIEGQGSSGYNNVTPLWRAIMDPIYRPAGSIVPRGTNAPTELELVHEALTALGKGSQGEHIGVLIAFNLHGKERAIEEFALKKNTIYTHLMCAESAMIGYMVAKSN